MSIKLMSKVFECDLPTSEKFVLLAMADYASDSGDSIFPSIVTLAKKTSLSDRTVQTCIKSLIDKNYLIMARNGGGRNHTNLYKIRCSRFTVTEKGEIDDLKGETVALKGEATSPEPSLTISLNQSSLILPAKNAGKPEPIRVPCDMDGIPDDWKDKPKKKQKHQPDPRYTHIAYSAFYSVTKKRPSAVLVDEVIKIIGDNPDIEHLRKCYIEWCSRGYNPISIKWLDWYTNGITGKQKVNQQDRNAEILKREYEEAINGEFEESN